MTFTPQPDTSAERIERLRLQTSDLLAALTAGANPAPLATIYRSANTRRAAWRIIHDTTTEEL